MLNSPLIEECYKLYNLVRVTSGTLNVPYVIHNSPENRERTCSSVYKNCIKAYLKISFDMRECSVIGKHDIIIFFDNIDSSYRCGTIPI